MKLNVQGRNIDVTEALGTAVKKKLGKLEKYFQNEGPIEVQVTLQVQKERQIVEVTMFINGMVLRGEEESTDMYASIDMVADKLERQIHKYKTRINRRARDTGGKPIFAPEFMKTEPLEEEYPQIVRTKRFAMKPMGVEEAVLQMELLGHDFFVFSNGDSEEVNVVYRRKDGNYGLIEPEF